MSSPRWIRVALSLAIAASVLPAEVLCAPVPTAAVQPPTDSQPQKFQAPNPAATYVGGSLYDLNHWAHLVTRGKDDHLPAGSYKNSGYRNTAKKAHPKENWTPDLQADHNLEAQTVAKIAGHPDQHTLEKLREHVNSPTNLHPLDKHANNQKGKHVTSLINHQLGHSDSHKSAADMDHHTAQKVADRHHQAQHTAGKVDNLLGGHAAHDHVENMHQHAKESLAHHGDPHHSSGSDSEHSKSSRKQPSRKVKH